MIQQRHRARAAVYLLGDIAASALAFFAAWWLRFDYQLIPLTKTQPEFGPYLMLLPVLLVLWPLVFYFHGLYQNRRSRSRVDEALTLLVAVLLATIILSGITTWLRPPNPEQPVEYFTYSRAFLALFVIADYFFVLFSRLGLRSYLNWRNLKGHNLRCLLVIGAGKLGKETAHKLSAHRELGFRVVGFLDDDSGKVGKSFGGIPVLGQLSDATRIIAEHNVGQVYIALPLEAHRKLTRLLQKIQSEGVEIKLVPDILQYATLNARLEDLDGTPVINLSQVPLQGWNSLVKRSVDFCFASLGLLALSPFLGVIALLIWRDDRGPIFYQQERMGLDGRSFMIWKFRSMRVNAEMSSGPVWAVKNDDRRTAVGEFIRRWSIDELPQLWNVVRGEMSLVGPRPERPTFVREFKGKIPDYMQRHRVKAGITGWAQVHGWRGNTSIKKRIQYDLYYIQNWSLKLDLKIIWMTFRYAIRLNAY